MTKIVSILCDNKYKSVSINFFLDNNKKKDTSITILTGNNGSSKSSVLRDIVIAANHVIGQDRIEIQVENETGTRTSIYDCDVNDLHIVAASGSLADRFPIKNSSGRTTNFDSNSYTYLGQRVGPNLLSKKNIIETIVINSLNRDNYSFFNNKSIIDLFSCIGLIPNLNFTFEVKSSHNKDTSFNEDGLGRSLFDELNSKKNLQRNVASRKQYTETDKRYMLDNFEYETFCDLHKITFNRNRKERIVRLHISDDIYASEITIDALKLGLYSGYISLIDCDVTNIKNSSFFSIFELSSGEYHFLTNILGIAVSAKEGSIILMDEPENNLHPSWQASFVRILTAVCQEKKVGHLILATHSPIIVSSANSDATIIDLSDNRATPEPRSFFGSSIDEILIDNFNVVSTRNYYFTEKLQSAIDLFAAGSTNNVEYRGLLITLSEYSKGLRNEDPILKLINTLQDIE